MSGRTVEMNLSRRAEPLRTPRAIHCDDDSGGGGGGTVDLTREQVLTNENKISKITTGTAPRKHRPSPPRSADTFYYGVIIIIITYYCSFLS